MKELLFFYLPTCPHCKLAIRCLDELRAENPDYAAISVKMVDESRDKAMADAFDYWYVPAFWYMGQKLHEGHAELADVRAVLDAVLAK